MDENNDKFVKVAKVIIAIFIILSVFNIIILINDKSYALFKRTVSSKRIVEIHVASEFPSKSGVDALKKKLGTGGLIGIPTTCSEESCNSITDKSADKSTIREYRYSGASVNNYVYFNCQDGKEQNADNCETWRIIGIFKDEAGEEHIKIVRDKTLSGIPSSYTANGKTFNLSGGTTSRWDTDSGYDNNWGDAGLMNWLNSKGTEGGYLNTLTDTAKGMIEEKATWYLGSVAAYSGGDTTILAYEHERAIEECSENKGPSTNNNQSKVEGNSTCRVWTNNAAYWEGEIGLMYPSDYGYASDSSNWSTKKLYDDYSTYITTNWLFQEANHSSNEWFLSPSSGDFYSVAYWYSVGRVSQYSADLNYGGVRPSLYLKSDIEVIDGEGTSDQPYKLQ